MPRNIGTADLMVVKQELLRYELGEIAHIENVLRGEYKERIHRRLRRVTEEITEEAEKTEKTERDLESTEKFELKRETEEVLKMDAKVQVGVESTHDWGPHKLATKFGASAGIAYEESKTSSTTYARDVVERAKSQVEERVLRRRVITTMEETEETNTHGIDNKGSQDHAIGIYRWLDKVYEAKVLNYGQRALFEFIVPEPAAFYLYCLTNSPPEGVVAEKPEPPEANAYGLPFNPDEDEPEKKQRLKPEHLTSETYQAWVARYNVSDVTPPPAEKVLFGKTFCEPANSSGDAKVRAHRAEELAVPDLYKGKYRAVHAWAFIANQSPRIYEVDEFGTLPYEKEWKHALQFSIGRGRDILCLMPEAGSWYLWQEYSLSGNWLESIPVALSLSEKYPESRLLKTGYVVNVEIELQRTDEALTEWQLSTYEAILQAYLQLKANYDDAMASAAIAEGISISGHNPLQNRDIERLELKRAIISQMTAQHFDLFDAMRDESEQGYPQMDLDEARAEGEYVQFFEQAFEWPQITYQFYPYFWGRKERWLDKVTQIRDNDPLFEAFLKAGGARVVVPARKGYEAAVAHFLTTGEIWNGGDPPVVDDPLYVSLIEDMKPKEVVEGEPWEVKLPTSLVLLQEGSELPGADG